MHLSRAERVNNLTSRQLFTSYIILWLERDLQSSDEGIVSAVSFMRLPTPFPCWWAQSSALSGSDHGCFVLRWLWSFAARSRQMLYIALPHRVLQISSRWQSSSSITTPLLLSGIYLCSGMTFFYLLYQQIGLLSYSLPLWINPIPSIKSQSEMITLCSFIQIKLNDFP